MTRMLTTAGAVALTASLMCGAARATAPAYYGRTAPAPTAQAASPQPAVGWHYIWQYRYNRWGGRAPGWVAVPNSPR